MAAYSVREGAGPLQVCASAKGSNLGEFAVEVTSYTNHSGKCNYYLVAIEA